MSDSGVPTSPLAGLGIAVPAASTSATLVRWSAAPSLVKAFYRVLSTVALLAPVTLIRHRGTLTTISGRDLLAAGSAGVALAAHFVSWLESPNHMTVAASITLMQFQPLFIAVGAWAILDECVSHHTVVGVGVAFADVTLMSVSDFFTAGGALRPFLGNGLAVVGAVTVAAYVLAGRSIRSRVSLVPYVVVVYSVCVAALLAVTVDRGDPLTSYPPCEWLLSLGTAIGPGASGHTVISWVLVHLGSSAVSVSLLGELVDSTILALFLLGEIPTFPTVLDEAVILGGIYVSAS